MLRPIINTFIAPLTGGPGDPAGLARALAVLAAVFAVGVFANYAQAKVMLTVAQNALQKSAMTCLAECRSCRSGFMIPTPTVI